VEHSGVGTDGGRDVLVRFRIKDFITSFERKWVVQCKFHEQPVSKSYLSTVNIPTLIHEYGANGYLLVCKNEVTSGVRTMFANLNDKCKFGYHYECWIGSDFKERLNLKHALVERFFPAYNAYKNFQAREKGL